MCDGTKITMFMETETTTIEKVDETKESEVEKTEETEESKKDVESDLDAEIEKEKKGVPDPEKARQAFKERENKRQEKEESDEDKPLTRKQLEQILSQDRQARFNEDAKSVARSLSGSDKEAELMMLRWQNRTFPSHLTLQGQMEEVYAGIHAKKIIGERNEALRALKNRDNVEKSPAVTHHDEPQQGEPTLSAADKQAITAVGFVWNGKSRQYEKKLSNGQILVRDSKTKQTRLIRAAK